MSHDAFKEKVLKIRNFIIIIITISSPPSLLSNGYRGIFHWEQSGRGVKLPTHLHLVPRSRMRGGIRLHGVVLT